MVQKVLDPTFFERDVLDVAPELLGKSLVKTFPDGTILEGIITEVEAYRGEEDLACHASKGRTPRTEVMYRKGGHLYIYLIYGMYNMLNIVTGPKDHPQAVLIRGTNLVIGPGRLTRYFSIGRQLNVIYLPDQTEIRVLNNNTKADYMTTPRIGIDYAGEEWKNKPWRFVTV